MENRNFSLLIIDDDEDDIFILETFLRKSAKTDLEIASALSYREGFEMLQDDHHDVCFVDYRLGPENGVELLRKAKEAGLQTQFVMLTGKGDQEIAVEAMKAGASDYLEKGKINPEVLERTLRYLMNRAENEKIAQQSRAIYRTIFEQSGDAIFILNDDFEIVEVNSGFRKYFPDLHRDFLPLGDLLPNTEAGRKLLSRIVSEPESWPENVKVVFPDLRKTPVTFLFSLSRLNLQDELGFSYLGMMRNITRFMKAQKQMQIAEKLSLTGRMSRVIGHEVRNPLTNIKLAVDQLRKTSTNSGDDLYLDILNRNADRISDLIDKLLESARPSADQRQSESLNDIIQAVLEEHTDHLNLSEIGLEKDLGENLPSVHASRLSLGLAISNLIKNAIDAMEGEETRRLSIRTAALRNGVEFSISDTGVGMDAETLNQIFDPYFSRKEKGSGLGLTATLNIIEAHKGELSVESTPGEGTVFTLFLPGI